MKINVFLERENKRKNVNVENKMSVRDFLAFLKINPVTAVVAVNSNIVTEEHKLSNGDNVEVLSVVSGG